MTKIALELFPIPNSNLSSKAYKFQFCVRGIILAPTEAKNPFAPRQWLVARLFAPAYIQLFAPYPGFYSL